MAHNTPGQVRNEFCTYFAGCRAAIEIRIAQEEERSAMKGAQHTHTHTHTYTNARVQKCKYAKKQGMRLSEIKARKRDGKSEKNSGKDFTKCAPCVN